MAQRLTRDQFRQWALARTGRYERVAGAPVAMSPGRIQHARIKSRVWATLDHAIRSAGVACEALPDGVTIEVDADTDYEPDAIVNCGPPAPATPSPRPIQSLWSRCYRPARSRLIWPTSLRTISGCPLSSIIWLCARHDVK